MLKFIKILKNYTIKNKLFDVVINKASNNNILKNKFKKTIKCREC